MRFQTCLFLKDGSMRSEVVRAQDTSDALRKMIATKDVTYAPCGYAHPLRQPQPDEQDWRWAIYCSVTGEVSMSHQKPPDA